MNLYLRTSGNKHRKPGLSQSMSPIRIFTILAISGLLALLSLLVASIFAQTPHKSAKENTAPESTLSQTKSDYKIHKGDKLSIKFLYQPELSDAAVIVRPDGKISLPMVEELLVEGLTVKELKTALEKAYREILLNPEITVSLVEFVQPHVFVSGQVNKPGSYELRAGQTLLQAVILAGGFTAEAHRKYVLHARPVGEHQLKVVAVDVTKMLKPKDNKEEIVLEDGDYIYIPNSKLAKFNSIVAAFRSFVPGYGLQF